MHDLLRADVANENMQPFAEALDNPEALLRARKGVHDFALLYRPIERALEIVVHSTPRGDGC
ncbi:MAG: hypothetical protein AAFQ88_14665, partial [Pseudomonadota bacterium]